MFTCGDSAANAKPMQKRRTDLISICRSHAGSHSSLEWKMALHMVQMYIENRAVYNNQLLQDMLKT